MAERPLAFFDRRWRHCSPWSCDRSWPCRWLIELRGAAVRCRDCRRPCCRRPALMLAALCCRWCAALILDTVTLGAPGGQAAGVTCRSRRRGARRRHHRTRGVQRVRPAWWSTSTRRAWRAAGAPRTPRDAPHEGDADVPGTRAAQDAVSAFRRRRRRRPAGRPGRAATCSRRCWGGTPAACCRSSRPPRRPGGSTVASPSPSARGTPGVAARCGSEYAALHRLDARRRARSTTRVYALDAPVVATPWAPALGVALGSLCGHVR